MYTDKDSVIVNNISLGDYIVQAKFGYHKLWSSDSGRNLAKSVVGTFDIFPKITVTFKKLSQEELETISPIVNALSQSTTYYDPDYKRMNTISTYTNDLEYVQKNIGKLENFDVSFIARNRRI